MQHAEKDARQDRSFSRAQDLPKANSAHMPFPQSDPYRPLDALSARSSPSMCFGGSREIGMQRECLVRQGLSGIVSSLTRSFHLFSARQGPRRDVHHQSFSCTLSASSNRLNTKRTKRIGTSNIHDESRSIPLSRTFDASIFRCYPIIVFVRFAQIVRIIFHLPRLAFRLFAHCLHWDARTMTGGRHRQKAQYIPRER